MVKRIISVSIHAPKRIQVFIKMDNNVKIYARYQIGLLICQTMCAKQVHFTTLLLNGTECMHAQIILLVVRK
jgi:hypothetical protein